MCIRDRFTECNKTNQRIYLFIDEYDHFTNAILSDIESLHRYTAVSYTHLVSKEEINHSHTAIKGKNVGIALLYLSLIHIYSDWCPPGTLSVL